MAMKKRIWYPDTSYHITARGNRKYDIFRDSEDFHVYITIMKNAIKYYDGKFKMACFCLMDNHIHILLQTTDLHMKEFITRVNSIYAKYFNGKYDYVGNLYQGRYYSELIKDDSQMLEVSRYIHLNPVRAGMVKKPEDYLWSSYNMFFHQHDEKLIDTNLILSYFNDNNSYKDFVESAVSTPGGLDVSEDRTMEKYVY